MVFPFLSELLLSEPSILLLLLLLASASPRTRRSPHILLAPPRFSSEHPQPHASHVVYLSSVNRNIGADINLLALSIASAHLPLRAAFCRPLGYLEGSNANQNRVKAILPPGHCSATQEPWPQVTLNRPARQTKRQVGSVLAVSIMRLINASS